MKEEKDYQLFGPEWEKEMMKFSKKYLIMWIKKLLIKDMQINETSTDI